MPKIDQYDYYLGIDPGQSGGIAVLTHNGLIALLEPMPDTEANVYDLISDYCGGLVKMAMIEKVHAMPQQGVSSTFKFGVGYGGLRMALIASDIPFEEVTPQAWQKQLGIVPRGRKNKESKTDHKRKLLAKAQQLFPKDKVTLKTADALLIAEYCRRKFANGEK